MKTHKGFKIDSKSRTIVPIMVGDYRDIQSKIGCDLFTCVDLNQSETLYVDDEGLLTINSETTFFLHKDYPSPLAGNGVILGLDSNTGDSKDSALTLEEIESSVKFMSLREVQIWIHSQGV